MDGGGKCVDGYSKPGVFGCVAGLYSVEDVSDSVEGLEVFNIPNLVVLEEAVVIHDICGVYSKRGRSAGGLTGGMGGCRVN